jgi:hypothetical protein
MKGRQIMGFKVPVSLLKQSNANAENENQALDSK